MMNLLHSVLNGMGALPISMVSQQEREQILGDQFRRKLTQMRKCYADLLAQLMLMGERGEVISDDLLTGHDRVHQQLKSLLAEYKARFGPDIPEEFSDPFEAATREWQAKKKCLEDEYQMWKQRREQAQRVKASAAVLSDCDGKIQDIAAAYSQLCIFPGARPIVEEGDGAAGAVRGLPEDLQEIKGILASDDCDDERLLLGLAKLKAVQSKCLAGELRFEFVRDALGLSKKLAGSGRSDEAIQAAKLCLMPLYVVPGDTSAELADLGQQVTAEFNACDVTRNKQFG